MKQEFKMKKLIVLLVGIIILVNLNLVLGERVTAKSGDFSNDNVSSNSIILNQDKDNELKITMGEVTKLEDGSIEISTTSSNDMKSINFEYNNKLFVVSPNNIGKIKLKFEDGNLKIDSNGNYVVEENKDRISSYGFVGQVTYFNDGHKLINAGSKFYSYNNKGLEIQATYDLNQNVEFYDDIEAKPKPGVAYIKEIDQLSKKVITVGGLNDGDSIDLESGILKFDKNNGFIEKGDIMKSGNEINFDLGNGKDIKLNGDNGKFEFCEGPCKEVGKATEILEREQFYDSESKVGFFHKLESNEILTDAYKLEGDSRVYKIINLDTGKETIYYSSGLNLFNYEEGKWFKTSKPDDFGDSVKIPLQNTELKYSNQNEIDIMKKITEGKLPESSVSLTPIVNSNAKWAQSIMDDNIKAGDVFIIDKSTKEPNIKEVLTLDRSTGNWRGRFEDYSFGKTFTPEQFDEISKNPNYNIEVYPYEYDERKSGEVINIIDSRDNIVGRIKEEGNKYNIYNTNEASLGVYDTIDDAKKAFEGKALHVWLQKKPITDKIK